MKRNISLIFPILGMQVLLILWTTLSHYYIEVNTLRHTLSENETDKAEYTHFIVESLIKKETSKLSGLSKALKNRGDLINGLADYISSGNITNLKNAMDMLFPQFEVDIFQIADRNKKVLYQAHNPKGSHEKSEHHGVVEAMLADDIIMASELEEGWAIRAIVPAYRGDDLYGTITLGMWIDDGYAQNISNATEVQVSIGSVDGVIASSLPKNERNLINPEAIKTSILTLKPTRVEYPKAFKVLHYAPIDVANEPFCLIIGIDTSPSFELLQKNKAHIIKVSVLILIIALSLAGGITMILLRPLKMLNSKAKETVRDLSGMDFKEPKGNEIKNLVNSFNVMVQKLSDHIKERRRAEDELKKHKEKLEDLVIERTTELRKSNEKLTNTIQELEWRTNEMMLLNKLGDLLQACDSEEETYNIIINICKQLFPVDFGYLCILDDNKKILKIVAKWGDVNIYDTEFEQNQCWAIRRGKEHIVINPDFDPICPHVTNKTNFGSLCVPMSAQGEVIGMIHISIGDNKNEKSLDDAERIIGSKMMLVKSIIERYAPGVINLRLRETLRIQSIRDPLTGLYNRRHMTESLEREARRVERRGISIGIIMIDVDHFKQFNDTYGHEAGDKVLIELGGYFKKFTRGEDIACRYGGEEFILILTDATLENTLNKAEEIREQVKENLKIKHLGKLLKITISLGVAVYPEHGETTEDAIKAADKALYVAKSKGRDCVKKAK